MRGKRSPVVASTLFVLAAVLPACGKDKGRDKAADAAPGRQTGADEKTSAGAGAADPAASAGDKIVVEQVGFKTPESVLYDPVADLYLVSNINGSPVEIDNNGFISRLRPDGELDTLRWIEGGRANASLSAPKGMAFAGDTLFVTDVTVVRKFDRETGDPRGAVAIEGATFLNDLCSGPDSSVYVSDSGMNKGSDAVHRIAADGSIETLISGAELGGPNGLVATDEGVWVVTYRAGELWLLGPDGEKKNVVKPPKGGLDGIVRLADGTLLISSWEAGALYRGPAAGPFDAVITDLLAPADIGYDEKRKRVLVPLFQSDAVETHPLE